MEDVAHTRSTPIDVFRDFAHMAACALSAGMREPEYLETAKRYTRQELDQLAHALGALTEEMQNKPFEDLLGPYYLEIGARSTQEARGEFFTPHSLADMIAQVLIDVDAVIAEGNPVTVSEPASGAGGMILSLAKQFAPRGEGEPSHVDLLRVTAIDINPTACHMTTVNTTLWGIPCKVIWGDTLRWQIHHEWPNIHWFRVGQHEIERLRYLWHQIEEVLRAPEPPKADFTLPPDPMATQQMDLFEDL